MNRHYYAVIMAGGKGTRFWPLSRPDRPKQLLKILSRKSLIRETVDRVLPHFGRHNTLVVTVKEHSDDVRRELRFLPGENFLVEPEGKNTAPCIGLAAMELSRRDPNAIMALLPADHWIFNANSFIRTLKAALPLAEKSGGLVTIGIRPDHPNTGYGYIRKGKKIRGPRGLSVYQVRGFKEKPAAQTARRLIRAGSLWNSGIFAWRAATILTMLSRFSPSIYNGLRKIGETAAGNGLGARRLRPRPVLEREYKKMPNISIDYAVLEKAGAEGGVLALEARFGWSDVGNWSAIHQLLPRDRKGNVGIGRWFGLGAENCLVYASDHLITLLGVKDTVVVETPDALFVGDLKRSQEVRELVEELKRKGYRRYT